MTNKIYFNSKERTFHSNKEDAFNNAVSNLSEEEKMDMILENGMVSKKELFQLIFSKRDEQKIEELKEWMKEVIEEKYLIEYTPEDIEDVYDSFTVEEKEALKNL